MSYVDEVLLRDEKVTYRARLHWWVFISLSGLLTLFIAPWIRRATSEFAVTDRRVIMKTGVLTRRTLELNLVKIESIGVDQSLLGRMFNCGTITIVGSGGTREAFPAIGSPLAFRRAVQEAIEDYTARHGVPGVLTKPSERSG
jgi:uncharacterized membrane protein YdbT with pleckstrin-like domain